MRHKSRNGDMHTPAIVLDCIWLEYGSVTALRGVTIEVQEGESVALAGRNGAGKTSVLRALTATHPVTSGNVSVLGIDARSVRTFDLARRGLSYVPEDRGIFPDLTVDEQLAVFATPNAIVSKEEAYERFPMLGDLRGRMGSNLSGGEQQMVAIARALGRDSHLVLLDEPLEGLAPILRREVLNMLDTARSRRRFTLLITSEGREAVSELADRIVTLDRGEVVVDEGVEQEPC